MTNPTRLELASTLEATGPSTFATAISAEWCIGAFANGGYLLSVALRAIGELLSLPHPLSATAYFMLPVGIGAATVEVETIREGRTLARAEARIFQDGDERVRVLATFGTLPAEPADPRYVAPPSFDLAPIGECARLSLGTPDGGPGPVRDRFDTRYSPSSVGWARGGPSGVPRLAAWVRAADGSEPDPLLVPVVLDALPCTAFELDVGPRVSTVELTVHLRTLPAPGWLRAGFDSRLVGDGFMEENGELWDSAGHLVAMSRQLAILPKRNGNP